MKAQILDIHGKKAGEIETELFDFGAAGSYLDKRIGKLQKLIDERLRVNLETIEPFLARLYPPRAVLQFVPRRETSEPDFFNLSKDQKNELEEKADYITETLKKIADSCNLSLEYYCVNIRGMFIQAPRGYKFTPNYDLFRETTLNEAEK